MVKMFTIFSKPGASTAESKPYVNTSAKSSAAVSPEV